VSDSTVYFVLRASDGAIKIGVTTDLRRRMSDLRSRHGQLRVLATVEGAAPREKVAHLIFSDIRLDGEFFQPTPELLAFVDQYGTPPPRADDHATGAGPTSARGRPWIETYGDPYGEHDRAEFVRDYETWIDLGLIAADQRRNLDVFRTFPERIVFVPQPGLSGWGWSPLNPRCWTDMNGRRLY
jgi:hypothetical protein